MTRNHAVKDDLDTDWSPNKKTQFQTYISYQVPGWKNSMVKIFKSHLLELKEVVDSVTIAPSPHGSEKNPEKPKIEPKGEKFPKLSRDLIFR